MSCSHDCLNCPFPDCINSDKPAESENIDQYVLTQEQLKRQADLKRWHEHGKEWAKTHKSEAKAYHHQYYMDRKEQFARNQREYRANKKSATRLASE